MSSVQVEHGHARLDFRQRQRISAAEAEVRIAGGSQIFLAVADSLRRFGGAATAGGGFAPCNRGIVFADCFLQVGSHYFLLAG
jgi:hypothetical protein